MQTQGRWQHKQRGWIPNIAMTISCAALIGGLLTCASSSIGGTHGDPAPAQISLAPAQPAGQEAAAADSTSERPTRPTCAGLVEVASLQQDETTSDALGCGVRSNLAGSWSANNQSEKQADVATLLAWHVQARGLIQ